MKVIAYILLIIFLLFNLVNISCSPNEIKGLFYLIRANDDSEKKQDSMYLGLFILAVIVIGSIISFANQHPNGCGCALLIALGLFINGLYQSTKPDNLNLPESQEKSNTQPSQENLDTKNNNLDDNTVMFEFDKDIIINHDFVRTITLYNSDNGIITMKITAYNYTNANTNFKFKICIFNDAKQNIWDKLFTSNSPLRPNEYSTFVETIKSLPSRPSFIQITPK